MADSKPVALQAAAAVPFSATLERVRPHTKLIGLLAVGHLVIDLTQGSLPAVLPFLKTAHGLSYAQAATIVLVANLTSSIIQPLFGYLADHTVRRWLLPASIFTAGAGMALIGLAPSYLAVCALVMVMGSAWPPGIPRATRRRRAWPVTARRLRSRGSRSVATWAWPSVHHCSPC
jgi:FSR family fosmidomycin resistance protein-like MFS transporter